MRYTHATGEGIRRAMQLLTQTGMGKGNGKVLQLQNWTDTKAHIKRERAACAARKCLIHWSGREDSNLRPHGAETCNLTVRLLRCDHIY